VGEPRVTKSTPWFRFRELSELVAQGRLIQYHAAPGTEVELRLLEHRRTYYRPDDFGETARENHALLPLGRSGTLALPGESYRLAVTQEHLDQIFGEDVNAAAVFSTEGGYLPLAGEEGWWIPTGRVFYTSEPDASPAAEAEAARSSFFLPRRFRGQHGHDT
jgi:hypothetical protein